MAKNLFVGSLPYSTTADELNELFSKVGTVVSCAVISDKMTHRSKGFGFVEMSTEEEAQKAIATYNQYELQGRKIVVNEAKPREER